MIMMPHDERFAGGRERFAGGQERFAGGQERGYIYPPLSYLFRRLMVYIDAPASLIREGGYI